MLFSNELNYWVIKKNAKKYLLLRMGRHIRAGLKTSKMWELPRKLDNNKTYSKADDRQRGENFSFY
ncbi:hypothetical protein KHM19_25430 [Leptospira borgpetersenii]|nr:hypothetical protein KHM09_26170 [Leptospira borgpetersenii]GIM23360.1 hypothetical protein KHM19_25430 [Leptospira borgpetersenii]GIM26625.1 hypothetical protein KHM25_25500 [Leptospira borgpetersenii]